MIGGAAFLLDAPLVSASFDAQGLRPFLHAGFWTPMCLALAALIGAWRLHRAAERDAAQLSGWMDFERLSQVLLAWGAGWWLFALIGEIVRFVPLPERPGIALLAIAASVALFSLLALRERWQALATACFGLGPLALVVLALSDWQAPPLAQWGWLGWGAWLAVHLWSLRRLEQGVAANVLRAAHVLGCWLLLGVLALEARALLASLADQHNAWRWLGWALVPSLFLILLGLRERLPWPVAGRELEYRGIAAAPVALVLLAWFWLVNLFSDGAADPLPYLPLLNPLELGMLIVLAAIVQWLRSGPRLLGVDLVQHARPLQALIGASLFALLTLAVCRTAHHWLAVPFDADALVASMAVQAGLSIVWALIALALMIVGHLRGRRDLWLVGAGLIGVVVAKLFFVELGNSGSLERIVSFIGVGVLMLVVGYFAPLPPKRSEEEPTPA
ncbi:MAG: hypothetical protein GAK43_01311 [Stenotrophomonas maltophilia]|nr:MAG: hypothetical protein GAK43_01311 [Stenotrophomonas maltophilia]